MIICVYWILAVQVFSAPHITRLSASLGTQFRPIRYILHGSKFISNVRYSSSLLREGWLSASGTLVVSDANTVQVKFDRFWVDTSATGLRQELRGTPHPHLSVCQ